MQPGETDHRRGPLRSQRRANLLWPQAIAKEQMASELGTRPSARNARGGSSASRMSKSSVTRRLISARSVPRDLRGGHKLSDREYHRSCWSACDELAVGGRRHVRGRPAPNVTVPGGMRPGQRRRGQPQHKWPLSRSIMYPRQSDLSGEQLLPAAPGADARYERVEVSAIQPVKHQRHWRADSTCRLSPCSLAAQSLRLAEQQRETKPRMSDLRESGLYRSRARRRRDPAAPRDYLPRRIGTGPWTADKVGVAGLIVAKQRLARPVS